MTPEDSLHRTVIDWLSVVHPDCLYWHVPNQAHGPVQWHRKRKALGVVSGVADLCFCLPGGKFGAIELKAPKGRPSGNQDAWGKSVREMGGYYEVCRSLPEVQGVLAAWGVNYRNPEAVFRRAGAI